MHVVLKPSPSVSHRYRVILPCHRTIDFGDKNTQYYADHGNSRLMRAQLIRSGAVIPKELRVKRDLLEIHCGMLDVKYSDNEEWENVMSRDFWERWMLSTYPDINKAKLWMTMNKGILFMPTPEDFWYIKHH